MELNPPHKLLLDENMTSAMRFASRCVAKGDSVLPPVCKKWVMMADICRS